MAKTTKIPVKTTEIPAIEIWPIGRVKPYPDNPRRNDSAVTAVANSIAAFGFRQPIVVDGEGVVICGHTRLKAAERLKMASVPILVATDLTPAQVRAYRIADNRSAELSDWDEDLLAKEIAALLAEEFDTSFLGFEEAELRAMIDGFGEPDPNGATDTSKTVETLAERFLVPPFSVLNARDGWWQARKSAWLASGLRSAAGRADKLAFSSSAKPWAFYELKTELRKTLKREPEWAEVNAEADRRGMLSDAVGGTSIFDPVLCEIAYRWFCPAGGHVLDPFAGGSVRGVVASRLGRPYLGVDLRPEQVAENERQAADLCRESECPPRWVAADSRAICDVCRGTAADFVFSCPPYADLERYSDDPADLSTMSYPEFRAAYRKIVAGACGLLKNDRFACFVVGEIRDSRKGNYRGFVSDTIAAFEAAGLAFYNEMILVTQAGSLPIRAGKQFQTTRKIGKTHQNVLVFLKGNAKKATEACGPVDLAEGEPSAAE